MARSSIQHTILTSGLFRDYGMVLVLLLLMLTFSLLTMKTQHPTGAEAGRQVAAAILDQHGETARVLIAVPASRQDQEFADAVRSQLTEDGATIVDTIVGSPVDLRRLLEKLAGETAVDSAPGDMASVIRADNPIDAIAATETSSRWNVYDRFPQYGRERCVVPRPYRWPDFLKLTNLIAVANQTAIYAMIAIGMTMVIISGGIDLSVGSLVALSSVTAAVMIRDIGGGESAGPGYVVMGCVAAIAVTAIAGLVNGVMVTWCSIPPFIVTLSMMMAASGLAFRISSGESVNQVPDTFLWLGARSTFGVPNPVLLMLAMYVVAHIIMSRTVFGRMLFAIGGNPEAARLSGIPVRRILVTVYTVCGSLAGLGGIVLSSRLDAGDPKFGDMYELEVIAAAVVGGTSLAGGEGRIFGTLIGAFIIAVIRNGMNLMSVSSFDQKIVLGTVLLAAVVLDRFKQARFAARGK